MNGVSIQHRGRQLQEHDLELFDFILAMDESNLATILRLPNAQENTTKIQLLRHYDSDKTGKAVPDPYYGTEKDFQEVFTILNRSIENLLNELTKYNEV